MLDALGGESGVPSKSLVVVVMISNESWHFQCVLGIYNNPWSQSLEVELLCSGVYHNCKCLLTLILGYIYIPKIHLYHMNMYMYKY